MLWYDKIKVGRDKSYTLFRCIKKSNKIFPGDRFACLASSSEISVEVFFSKLSFLDFDQIRLQPFISYFLLEFTPPLIIIRHKEVWLQIRYPFLTPKITGYSKPWHLFNLPVRVAIALYHMRYVGSITAWPKWWSQLRRCQHHGELLLDTYPSNHGQCCGHDS